MEYYIRILLLISAAGAVVYGIVGLVRGKSGVLNVMATGAVACFTLGRLYDFITIFIRGALPTVFNLGMVSRAGAFFFILSLASAKLNVLFDGKNPAFKKQRFLALLGPVLILAAALPVWLLPDVTVSIKIAVTLIGCVAAMAGYYNCKLFLLPKNAYGLMTGLRWHNLLSLLLLFFHTAQLLTEKMNGYMLWYVASFAIVLLYPLFIISMFRGSKK